VTKIYVKPSKDGWPEFRQTNPVKIKQLNHPQLQELNTDLERDIKHAGDRLEHTTAAKCYMTQWDMGDHYESFKILGNAIISFAESQPLGVSTNQDGSPGQYALRMEDYWSLIYTKGQITKSHHHWPHVWSFTYCVKGCQDCSPLVFPDADGLEIKPKPGQLILWPSLLYHEVPEQKCDHERIMAVGNIDVDWEKTRIPVSEHKITPPPKGRNDNEHR
jgi:hypothetical protein